MPGWACSASMHKEAAFLASTAAASGLCHKLDPAFSLDADTETSEFGVALSAYNAKLPPGEALPPSKVAGAAQKSLSAKIDEAGHARRLAGASVSDQATLVSECQDGAKDFWSAVPSKALGVAVP